MGTHQKALDSRKCAEKIRDAEKQEESKSGEPTGNKRHRKRTVVSSRKNKRDKSKRSAVLSSVLMKHDEASKEKEEKRSGLKKRELRNSKKSNQVQ